MEEIKNVGGAQVEQTPEQVIAGLRDENNQLRQYISNLHIKMNQMQEALVEKRIALLFKVVENAIQFDDEFVTSCVKEIKSVFATPEQAENQK